MGSRSPEDGSPEELLSTTVDVAQPALREEAMVVAPDEVTPALPVMPLQLLTEQLPASGAVTAVGGGHRWGVPAAAVPTTGPTPQVLPLEGEGLPLERGEHIGRYVILKTLGQGGMGVVYAAYDPELDRKLAIKLLQPESSHADLAGGSARLQREAQAMARVNHPNVCTVFDTGIFEGQVFVAMECIEGPSLKQWLEQPRSWREVLEVFIQAGRGLHAAHEVGLVHRDFKPANVLVGKGGRAYVTDFGLARLVVAGPEEEPHVALPAEGRRKLRTTSQSSLRSVVTQVGLVMGTPQYMPPEQYLRQPLDSRSDQFSFCAALYWALYRKRPFEPQRVMEAAQELSLQSPRKSQGRQAAPLQGVIDEPPKDSKVPAWVRRAVMRGLALRPEQRFPSMKELLEELSQEPRLVRRRWALASAGVGVLVALGVALQVERQGRVCAGAEQLLAPVWSPEVRQRLGAAFAATSRPFAADAAQRIGQLLDAYREEWVRQHTEACVAARVQGVQPESIQSLRVLCLERRRKDLQALLYLLTEEVDGKLVERAVDAVHALPSLQQCQDIASLADQVPLPSDPARRAEIERLDSQLAKAKALSDMGRYKPALELAQQLEPQVLATAYPPLQADLHAQLGRLLDVLNSKQEGIRRLELAVRDAERGRVDRTKMEALNRLVFIHGSMDHQAMALLWAGLAEATLERMGRDHLLEVEMYSSLGTAAFQAGQLQRATELFEKASQILKKSRPPGDPRLAKAIYSLGMVAMRQGHTGRAVALLEEALQQTVAAKGDNHPDVANRHAMLSWAYREEQRHEPALRHAQEAVRIRKAVFGEQSPLVADVLDAVGMSLISLRRYDEARQTFEATLGMRTQALGASHDDLAFSYDGIGRALLEQGHARRAIAPLEKALTFQSEEGTRAEIEFNLAQALGKAGQRPQALALAQRARERLARLGTQGGLALQVDAWLASARAQPAASAPGHAALPP